jgi:hypothetical protein
LYVFIDPFTITAVLHSSGTFVSGKMTISGGNRDVISTFYCSTTSFYGKGYYYYSQISRRNAGPQLWWKDLLLLVWRIIAFHFVIIVYFFNCKCQIWIILYTCYICFSTIWWLNTGLSHCCVTSFMMWKL